MAIQRTSTGGEHRLAGQYLPADVVWHFSWGCNCNVNVCPNLLDLLILVPLLSISSYLATSRPSLRRQSRDINRALDGRNLNPEAPGVKVLIRLP